MTAHSKDWKYFLEKYVNCNLAMEGNCHVTIKTLEENLQIRHYVVVLLAYRPTELQTATKGLLHRYRKARLMIRLTYVPVRNHVQRV